MEKKKIVKLFVIFFIFFIVLVFVADFIHRNNKMVTLRENVVSQWANVESVYQRRLDLIPNLEETVKGSAEFEKGTLTAVIEARSNVSKINVNANDENSVKDFQNAQTGLSNALSRLIAVVESYPDLKASQAFLNLQTQLEGTENRISVERTKYNEKAQKYNSYIKKFPNSFIARIGGFVEKSYFQSDKGAEKAPKVNF